LETRSCFFPWPAWTIILLFMLPAIAEMRGMPHHTQLFSPLSWYFKMLFLPSSAWNSNASKSQPSPSHEMTGIVPSLSILCDSRLGRGGKCQYLYDWEDKKIRRQMFCQMIKQNVSL
jgi:hypothetical protein